MNDGKEHLDTLKDAADRVGSLLTWAFVDVDAASSVRPVKLTGEVAGPVRQCEGLQLLQVRAEGRSAEADPGRRPPGLPGRGRMA